MVDICLAASRLGRYPPFVYTTQVSSALRAHDCLTLFTSKQLMRQNRALRVSFPTIFRYIDRNKLDFFGFCVENTKTIIPLSPCENGG